MIYLKKIHLKLNNFNHAQIKKLNHFFLQALKKIQAEADKKIVLLLQEIERLETLNHKLCEEVEERRVKFEEMEVAYKRKFEGFKREIEEFKNDQMGRNSNQEQEAIIKLKTKNWEEKISSIIAENQKLNELVSYWQGESEVTKERLEDSRKIIQEMKSQLSAPRANEIIRKLEREKEELTMAYAAIEAEYKDKLKIITDQDIKIKGFR